MGDFLEQRDFQMDEKIERLLVTHANVNKNEECCGFIALDNIKQSIIVPCENIYDFPGDGFKVCPHEFLKIKQKYEIVCLYHSHPRGDSTFSKKDLDQAEELSLPICVYSLQDKSFNIHFPKSCPTKSFIGREYIHHFQNCWKLIYDYYDSEKKLIDRNFNFYLKQEQNKNFANEVVLRITDFFKRNNIKKIKREEAKIGDLVIFEASKKCFSHFGILLEDNEFMHHQGGFLSSRVLLNEDYIKKIHSIYRPILV